MVYINLKNNWKKHRSTCIIVGALFILGIIYFFFNGNVGSFTKQFEFTFKPSRKECKKKHEHRCREILEDIYYPHKFPSSRPNFLKNPSTGKNLEIDCYNHQLKIGLEYQGRQHTEYMPYFHRTRQDFEYQLHKDKYKKMQCQRVGIKMIYVPHTVKYDDLFTYIQSQL